MLNGDETVNITSGGNWDITGMQTNGTSSGIANN